jgi:monofunctional biosynthetic peptidoglycan transglycosylase
VRKLILLFITLVSFSQTFELTNGQSIDLINPKKNVGIKNWNIVNDDVMGGVSISYLSINDENNLIFRGYLSLENNGGFASSRLSFTKETLTGVKSFKIKFKGDGNTYKLRLRQNNRRASYSCDFKSFKDKWVEVNIQIEDFKPSWRGYSYSNYPALDIKEINSLGLQISDKQEGEFKLEIKYIKAIYK